MFLKRLYEKDSDGRPTAVRGVKVLHAGPRQRFSPELVLQAMSEGWMKKAPGPPLGSLALGTITLCGDEGDIVYVVKRDPGFYCCHCGEKQGGSSEARRHVAEAHAGAASPDASNPAGYERIHFYDCVRE